MKHVLSAQTVKYRLTATTKVDALEELLDLLQGAGRLLDRAACQRAILERERKMSTGLQNGVAIPHGKTDGVSDLVAAVGLKAEGIPFDSLDGQPARIVVMTLSPLNRSSAHIQFLASISKCLGDAALRDRLLQAPCPEDVMALLAGNVA